jgi:hypothetical protein
MKKFLESLLPYIINSEVREITLEVQKNSTLSVLSKINGYFPIELTYYDRNSNKKCTKIFLQNQIEFVEDYDMDIINYNGPIGEFFKEDPLYRPACFMSVNKKNTKVQQSIIPVIGILDCKILKSHTLFLSYEDFSSSCTLSEEEKKSLYERYIKNSYLTEGKKVIKDKLDILYNKKDNHYIKINNEHWLLKDIF